MASVRSSTLSTGDFVNILKLANNPTINLNKLKNLNSADFWLVPLIMFENRWDQNLGVVPTSLRLLAQALLVNILGM